MTDDTPQAATVTIPYDHLMTILRGGYPLATKAELNALIEPPKPPAYERDAADDLAFMLARAAREEAAFPVLVGMPGDYKGGLLAWFFVHAIRQHVRDALNVATNQLRGVREPQAPECIGIGPGKVLYDQKPVAWRVKDFADGWIMFTDELTAKHHADTTGAIMQSLAIVEEYKPVKPCNGAERTPWKGTGDYYS